MNKLSKLLVMALLILAVVAVSVNVNAYTNADLLAYVNGEYTIGDNTYSLSEKDKVALTTYLSENPVSDDVATSIRADLDAIRAKVEATGATSIDEISASVMAEVTALAQAAGQKAGLAVSINTADGILTIATDEGKVLVSTTYVDEKEPIVPNTPVEGENSDSSDKKDETSDTKTSTDAKKDATSSKSTLLYTGANSLVFVLPVLAIVAVAIVAKKRA